MEGIIPILFGMVFIIASYYNLRRYVSYKKGIIRDDAIVTKVEWKPRTFPVKFDFLFDKDAPVVTYRFLIGTTWYEKTEEAFMQFRTGAIKEGSLIKIYIPHNNNANRVTILDPFKGRIQTIWMVALMGLVLITI